MNSSGFRVGGRSLKLKVEEESIIGRVRIRKGSEDKKKVRERESGWDK